MRVHPLVCTKSMATDMQYLQEAKVVDAGLSYPRLVGQTDRHRGVARQKCR